MHVTVILNFLLTVIYLQSKVYPRISGPVDSTNTAIIGLCMQEYFLKLFASYREFVELDGPEEGDASQEEPQSGVTARRTHQDDGYLRYECQCLNEIFERLHWTAIWETCWSCFLPSCNRCCLPNFCTTSGQRYMYQRKYGPWWPGLVCTTSLQSYRESSNLSLTEDYNDALLSVQCLVSFVAV